MARPRVHGFELAAVPLPRPGVQQQSVPAPRGRLPGVDHRQDTVSQLNVPRFRLQGAAFDVEASAAPGRQAAVEQVNVREAGVPKHPPHACRGHAAAVIVGNHDVAVTRAPFSRPAELDRLPATLLVDESRTVDVRGVPVQIAGAAPRASGPVPEPDEQAAFRILLSHYPRLRAPGYRLVLAGHMHAGQIVLPYPGGKIRLAHLRAPLNQGVYRAGGITLHVSPGLGTTFVPLRFFARPEATELVLRAA